MKVRNTTHKDKMKALLVILLLYATYCIAENGKVILKKFPKKVSPRQFINVRRFAKSEPVPTKRANVNKDYTVFPPVFGTNRNIDIPDSPYFQHPPNVEQKIRIKKVLPKYVPARKKRSINKELKENKPRHNNTKLDFKDGRDKIEVSKAKIQNEKSKHHNFRAKIKKSKVHNKDKRDKLGKHKASKKEGKQGRKSHKNKENHLKMSKSQNKKKEKRNKSNKDGRRLIAGRDAMIEEYPYVVSIQKNKEHWCSGALINPRLVITTANCLWKASSISRMRVRVGSRFIDRGGQMAKIQEVMKHPYWGIRRNPDNDVALVLLDRNVRFTDAVHSVDLPNHAMMPAFDDAWVTSWGAERRDGIYDAKTLSLQVYHTRLMSREKCNNVTQRFGITVSENFICLSQTGKRAPCTRDTGAPAVSDGVLWGLASWGIRKLCGTERFPAMFSYLASPSNMDFIANATHTLMADQRHYPFPDRYPQLRSNGTLLSRG